jgi:hypothetical protein
MDLPVPCGNEAKRNRVAMNESNNKAKITIVFTHE